MVKLMKYLKGSGKSIVLIILLLIAQAFCDLALPSYTSNIVNVGIQQGGIDSHVPEVIREDQMEKLMIFVEDEQLIEDSYELLDKEDYSKAEWSKLEKRYPALEEENLYQLKSLKDEELQKVAECLKTPEMMVSFLSAEGEEAKAMREQLISQIKQSLPKKTKLPKDIDLFELLAALPKEAIEQMTDEAEKNISSMSDSMTEQMAVAFVKAEYEAIGMDMQKVQNGYLFGTGAKMLGISLLMMAASILVTLIAARVAASLGKNLRDRVFERVLSFSNAEFDKFSTASLITRTTNDIQQVQILVVMMLRMLFYAPIIGVGGVFKVFHTNTSMAWIIAVAVAAITCVIAFLFFVVMPKFKILQKLVDQLNLVTREILSGIMVIRAFSREKYEEKRFDKANRELTKTNLFVNRVMSMMMPLMMLIMNLITVMIVWFGAKGIDAGQMQVGDMMAFITYTMQIIMSFLMIAMMSIMLPRALVSVQRIDEVLTTESSIVEKSDTKKLSGAQKGVVCFNHVNFAYPDADEDVLHDIHFTARPGQTTAIIGSTGCGKSTLVQLIPRFFDVTSGAITVDGVDVRDAELKQLREVIGYVPQKGLLFSGTIASNIKFAHDDITDEQMKKAAKIAQAEDFILQKEDQYEDAIAQGGSNVSGGQKQRLSIARAIAKAPEIYIFDDSFSALDYKTDVALRRALKEETKDATVIIVAQRISTILHADQIIVLDEGKIAGIGTHEQLLRDCEVYYQIASSQLSEEELNNATANKKEIAEKEQYGNKEESQVTASENEANNQEGGADHE
ncbi:MAG: ABC transporter ATP-binding protein/permease [Clostridiales bacterium]|nr:ABC transporter ATP-binding protein/permease [Clostridiales bacterium]